MPPIKDRWLAQLLSRNAAFREDLDPCKLPVARTAGRFGLITCMDPRINPAALGIAPFGDDGTGASEVRIIRTIGAMAEDRSLIVGIHLAGIREFAIVMHTDCGNCLAKAKIHTIAGSLRKTMPPAGHAEFQNSLSEPLPEGLVRFLKAFDDPYQAVAQEVQAIGDKAFVPRDVVLHGLVYDLASAELTVVVDGYGQAAG